MPSTGVETFSQSTRTPRPLAHAPAHTRARARARARTRTRTHTHTHRPPRSDRVDMMRRPISIPISLPLTAALRRPLAPRRRWRRSASASAPAGSAAGSTGATGATGSTGSTFWAPETLALHADAGEGGGAPPGRGAGGVHECSVAPPISMTTTYLADVHEEGYVYARDSQPIRTRCEKVISGLEGGHAVLYGSGLAATFATLYHLNPRRVAVRGGYHGTHNVLGLMQERHGVEVVDLDEEVGEGDVIWVETPRNPMCEVYDIEAHAARAASAGAALVVDATLAPPPLQRALASGAHVAVHSATKYYAGHSDALLGVAVARERATGDALRAERSALGSVPGGLESWLLLRSLRTLHMRVLRQSQSAAKIAAWLDAKDGGRHHGVTKVHHPSLLAGKEREVAERQMPGGFGGILAVELDSEKKKES